MQNQSKFITNTCILSSQNQFTLQHFEYWNINELSQTEREREKENKSRRKGESTLFGTTLSPTAFAIIVYDQKAAPHKK